MGPPPLIAAAQMPAQGRSAQARLDEARAIVERAQALGVRLLVFPEGYLPGYALARPDDALGVVAAREALRRWSRELDMVILMGTLTADGSGLTLVDPERGLHLYRKRFPTLREAGLFPAGTGPMLVDTVIGRVGVLLCAELLQPAAWAPFIGQVELVAIASAWPSYPPVPRHALPGLRELGTLTRIDGNAYRRRLIARAARAVGAPVLFANATGPFERRAVFAGESAIWDAQGTPRAEASGRRDLITLPLPPTAPPGPPLRAELAWGLFNAAHLRVAKARLRLWNPSHAVVR
ncbi:MAG: carbon-nitrogen hydrolase family protein [Alphaproteobacteria bacterium]|nr:carbon-nitrogen hydrolase family protein [Alphaproteobacteria bacterium]MCB9795976.1 carbon-nitrogen hydrolase family protein [Alphaproteobacteria bacterium]